MKRKLYRIGNSKVMTLPKKLLGKKWHWELTYGDKFLLVENNDNCFKLINYKKKDDYKNSNNIYITEVKYIGTMLGIFLTKYILWDKTNKLKQFIEVERLDNDTLLVKYDRKY